MFNKSNRLQQVVSSLIIIGGVTIQTACNDMDKHTNSENFRDLNNNGQMEPYENSALSVDDRVKDLISRMTLDQKLRFVMGTGMDDPEQKNSRVPGVAADTFSIKNLGIPPVALVDGPAGVRILPKREGVKDTFYATAFPIATAIASSWDVELADKVGRAMGHEVKEYGLDLFLAPGMNIHRNPLGGRNFEYYSEDPVLTGNIAAAMVRGVQSNDVGATIKHFAANNQETNRFLVDTTVSERALREIYLRGFQIAVQKGKPWAVMSSYNKINGVYTPQDEKLLTAVLRNEWGFEGLVMSDWFAGDNAVEQMKAGNDLIMPGVKQQLKELQTAVADGQLEEAVLDRNLTRILKVILRTPSFNGYRYSDKPDLKSDALTARQAAANGIVLLKNKDNTLPLTDRKIKIATFGNTSYDYISGGTGSGDVNEAYTVSLVDGLDGKGYQLDRKLEAGYQQYIKEQKAKQPQKKYFFDLLPPIDEMTLGKNTLDTTAKNNDLALITIGRNSGEFNDRKVKGDFDLTDKEQQLIADVSGAFHSEGKRVVVVLNIGNVVETASWRDKVDAIVLPWQGGQEAGNAVADVLSGDVNPSGRLPTTFPVKYSDVPSAKSFPGETISDELQPTYQGFLPMPSRPSRVKMTEGIYVGYRYYDSFNVQPAYEFGYGLSYSQFQYGKLNLNSPKFDKTLEVSIEIKNEGQYVGQDVVQLYLSAPQDQLRKPRKELKAFAKTRLLHPGETEVVTFKLEPEQLASFDTKRRAWIAEPGEYQISIGASSRNIKAVNVFTLGAEIITQKALARFKPNSELKELL